jgi:hypothetical protein
MAQWHGILYSIARWSEFPVNGAQDWKNGSECHWSALECKDAYPEHKKGMNICSECAQQRTSYLLWLCGIITTSCGAESYPSILHLLTCGMGANMLLKLCFGMI